MIKLQVIGNLGKDCIMKEVNGRNVINFSVAHTERYRDAQGNQKDRTTWVECAYWTDRTGIAPYLLKGQMVFAEGSPEADGYLNKDGQAAATLRMRVQTVQLLGSRNQTGEAGGAPSYGNNFNQPAAAPRGNFNSATASVPTTSSDLDDLPF